MSALAPLKPVSFSESVLTFSWGLLGGRCSASSEIPASVWARLDEFESFGCKGVGLDSSGKYTALMWTLELSVTDLLALGASMPSFLTSRLCFPRTCSSVLQSEETKCYQESNYIIINTAIRLHMRPRHKCPCIIDIHSGQGKNTKKELEETIDSTNTDKCTL